MKKTLTILGLIIAMAIQSQNWSPILPGEKMNYRHSDSAYITNTIWVDSTEISSGDITFYLNVIVKDVPNDPDIVLRNQPQFLLKTLIKQDNGVFICTDPSDYLLFTLAGLGDIWVFTNNISAEITNIAKEDIFGEQDSVKTINLSDGNEIRLSKNFGILKFPDFQNGGYFELVGIQDTELGEQVIDFWDIFDYEVGDVFQRFYTESFPPPISYFDQHILKSTINSKEVFDDHITYGTFTIEKGFYSWYGTEPTYYSNTYTGNATYSVSDYEITNRFQNELIQLNDYYCSPNSNDYIFARISIYPDSMDLVNKHWGTFRDVPPNVFYLGLYYETSPSNDSLKSIYDDCFANGPHGMNYTESLGITLNYITDSESHNYFYLMGYVKDGDTVGEITPDSVLITNIEKKAIRNPTFSIFPNPAKDWLYVKPKDLGNGISYSIKFRDIFGQLIREKKKIRSSLFAMDISGLKSGVYFYEIEESSGNVQKGKFIVK
ncbi:MAG: T9SS type A sorting domain-containing protein [Chlorobi bacterium]|nr:T9SS type A sorting domain-containing protein [Chlorobiota bacterium]